MKKVGFFRSIQLKFIIVYILLLLLAIMLIGSFFTRGLEEELFANFKGSVDDRVELLNYNLEQIYSEETNESSEQADARENVQQIVDAVGTDGSTTKIQVINNQSRVIAVNDTRFQDEVGQKVQQPMVQQVLFFDTSDEGTFINGDTGDRVYVKVQPIFDGREESAVGAIFLEASLENVYGQLENINQIFVQGALIAIIVAAFIGVLVARAITRPIVEMREQAQIMAKGDFSQKVNVYGKDEIGQLAETFNDLNIQLKYSYATIDSERRKLSSVLSNMSDGVIATDNDGIVTLMNHAAGRLIGEDPEQVIGQFLLDVLHLEERIVDITELEHNGSMIIDFSEDQPFLIRANFSTISDDVDEISGFITVLSDVTEDERVEQERRDFVSNVSHELRTPLTTLKSYIEALNDGAWQDPGIAPKFLNVTQKETDRMIRMVNDLLQLSRMDAEEYPIQMEKTDFVSYLNHIVDRFEMNDSEHITFVRKIPKGDYLVWMDKDKMTQVLDNIISNAIKYSPQGGKITVRAEYKRNYLLISVTDEGMGIAYDKLEKIFDRFYRVDKARTRKFGGTGLGLAITKELVEAHHGQIWAKSSEGKGTAVYFTLPLLSQKGREDV